MCESMLSDFSANLPRLVPRLYRKMTYIPQMTRRFLRPLPARYASRYKQPKQLDPSAEREIARRVKRTLEKEKNRPREFFVNMNDDSEEFCYKYGNYPRLDEIYEVDENSTEDNSGSSSDKDDSCDYKISDTSIEKTIQ